MGRQATNKQQAHWHCGARKGLRMKVLTVSEDGNRVVMWGKKKRPHFKILTLGDSKINS